MVFKDVWAGSYNIILTLEMMVDLNQELVVKLHADPGVGEAGHLRQCSMPQRHDVSPQNYSHCHQWLHYRLGRVSAFNSKEFSMFVRSSCRGFQSHNLP